MFTDSFITGNITPVKYKTYSVVMLEASNHLYTTVADHWYSSCNRLTVIKRKSI